MFSVCKSQTDFRSKIKVDTNKIKSNDSNDIETDDTLDSDDLVYNDTTSSIKTDSVNKKTSLITYIKTNETSNTEIVDSKLFDYSDEFKIMNSVVCGDYSPYNNLLSNYLFTPNSGNQAGLYKDLIYQGIKLKGSDYNLNNLNFNDEFNIDFLPLLFINNIEFEYGINSIINSNNSVPISILLNSKNDNVIGSYTNLMFCNNYNSSTIFDGNYKRSFDNKINTSVGFRQIKGNGDFNNQKKIITTLGAQLYFPLSTKFNINIDNIYSSNSIGESMGIINDSMSILNPKDVVNDTLTKVNVYNLLGICGDYIINEKENIDIILTLNYQSDYFTSLNNTISLTPRNSTKFTTDKTITLNYSKEFINSDLDITLNLGNTSKKSYYQIGTLYNFYTDYSKITLGTKFYYEGGVNSIYGLDYVYYINENFHLYSSFCKNLILKDKVKIDQFVDSYFQLGARLLDENCLNTSIFYMKEKNLKKISEKSGVSLSFKFPFFNFTIYSSNNYYFKNIDLIYSFYSNNQVEYLLGLFNKNLEVNFKIGCELTSFNNYNVNTNLTGRIGNSFINIGLNNVFNSYFETIIGFPYRSRSFNFGVNWSFID